MKKIFFLLLVAAAGTGVKAQGLTMLNKPKPDMIALKEPSFDFGKIIQGHPVTHEFEVSNTAKDTVKIENVVASCGCTTPTWKKDPVAPGAATVINVGYNAASEGPFEKQVFIYYNGGQVKTIAIRGNVYKGLATSAPQNASIELLKQTSQ